VPHSVTGEGYKDVALSGLSLYIPKRQDLLAGSVEAYSLLPKVNATGWLRLLRTFADATRADGQPPQVAQPQIDATVVVPGSSQATVSGVVTDETMVTGVVVGVVGLFNSRTLLFGFDEQPRTYSSSNGYSYIFDGQGWWMADGERVELVFTVQWRQGQRAVFGSYSQDAESEPVAAYFVFDEATGELIEGFEVVGGALGALLPSDMSSFQPFLYTPELDILEAESLAIQGAILVKGPLPEGEYLISVTGFDLGDNAATGGVLVSVQHEATPEDCEPLEMDAASTIGEHNARIPLGSGESITLGLVVDRNRVGEVRYAVDVFGGDTRIVLENIGPDGSVVGASGTVHGHASDTFQPALSGVYQLSLDNETGGDKTVFLTWDVLPNHRIELPPLLDLDADPSQVSAFEAPGLRIGTLTIPGGQSLTASLQLSTESTPWLGYSIELSDGGGPLQFAVVSPEGEPLDAATVCDLHMGGFALTESGEHQFVFDNRKGSSDLLVTIWLEGYDPAMAPESPVTLISLPDWASGEHSDEFELGPGQALGLVIPFDTANASQAALTLTRISGLIPIEYGVVTPNGDILFREVHDYLAQNTFPIEASGEHVIMLDNRANNSGKTVLLSLAVSETTPMAPPPVQMPTPVVSTPTPKPGDAIVVKTLPDWSTGNHSTDITLPAGRVMRLVIPFDSSQSSRADFTLSGVSGSGSIKYQVLDPNGVVLVSGSQGYLTQDAFAIGDSGEYTIVLDNSGNTTSRTVALNLYVKPRE
jgi:hypothetical protein